MFPIFPYIGGKRRLAKHILPIFPDHISYCEPFAGAAALFFMKDPSKCEILNDVNGDIVALYRVVQNHLEELIRQYKWALTSREMFKWISDTPPETLTDIQRAARFFYIQKLCFGSKVETRSFGVSADRPPRFNLLRIEEDLSEAHFRLSNVVIEHLDWRECIRRYDKPETLFYCDPPYWKTDGYGVEFGIEQYGLLADVAKSINGRIIISVNDIPEMRDIFNGLAMKTVRIDYHIDNQKAAAKRAELIIRSW
jgi:DNA adenine methylase